FRANDDGEPSNTAGMPIYGQIQSFGVTNVLIVVVRFFGGVKLGVSGLISAYREAARLALESSDIIEKTINVRYRLSFDYKNMNKVMRIIKEKHLEIISQKMEMDCEIIVAAPKKNSESVLDSLDALFEVTAEQMD
ncbi:MAG: YigZ family protein, partial [Flavobacterium sp.]